MYWRVCLQRFRVRILEGGGSFVMKYQEWCDRNLSSIGSVDVIERDRAAIYNLYPSTLPGFLDGAM